MPLSHFQNAHHFEANNGQFINAATGANLTINNNADPLTLILRQFVATAATFDSAERFPPGRCHPGTRERIIAQIINWIDDPAPAQSIVWLYGPAGSGKSALAQSICEHLEGSRPKRNGASFFFANGLADRGNGLKLLTTISYQLAINFPSVRAEINKALERDPTLPTKSMEIQLQSLIVQPLLQCEDFPSHSPIIIIDGLDECADDEQANTQRNIVALIAKSIVDYKLPLRFFVASRPEYWIRDAFDIFPLPRITLSLSLQDELDADQDIRTYLTDEFERIRLENKRVMGSVTLPWPPKQVIEHLVYEASGQFIYASTVIRFVGKSSRFNNPQEQLRIITSPGPQRAIAFSELDRLYARILSAYPRWETMKHVLQGLLIYGSLAATKVFLNVDPGEVVLVVDALGSLIDITESDDEILRELLKFTSTTVLGQDRISFCHLSFIEFLKDETRSGIFYIDVDGFRDEIPRSLFGLIHQSIDEGYRNDRYLELNIDFAAYHWVLYKVAIESLRESRFDTLRPLISRMTERLTSLVNFPFVGSIESLVCFAEDMRVLDSAIEASAVTSPHRKRTENSQQLTDLHTLFKRFQDAVSLAQERAIHLLKQCGEFTFTVTPVLVYLAEFHRDAEYVSLNTLAIMTGTVDVISTVKHHRHFMRLSYLSLQRQWCLKFVNLGTFSENGGGASLRIQDSDEWRDQRRFLAHQLLDLASGKYCSYSHECCSILKERFFDLRSITDICSRERLRSNACKCLSLLESIGNLHLKQALVWIQTDFVRHVPNFITSIICWLNRQLTNRQCLKLLRDHGEALPQNMTATMNYLFEKFFLPHFNKFYTKQIYARGGPFRPRNAITIKVLPLPQGSYVEESRDDFSPVHEVWLSEPLDWHNFHDEVFGKSSGNLASSTATSPRIDCSCWFPHLALRLLNALVKFLYGQVHQRFSISDSWDDGPKLKYQKSVSCLPQCLPFAHPTSENLQALRLIVYLYPQVIDASAVTPLLPEAIWHSIAAFLRKYPRSLLSTEEQDLFESWLYSPDHLDISKYVHP